MTFTIIALLAAATSFATGDTVPKTHQIFWDSSNDLFQSSRNPTTLVRLGDRLDFTCGASNNIGNAYLVRDLHKFKNCDTTSRHTKTLFNCEAPGTRKTIKILEVNPHPYAPVFLPGEDYYLVGGNCAEENLRMIIRVDSLVAGDGLARVVTEESEIIETPNIVEVLTSQQAKISNEPDLSANNTQLNQLLIGVALGVLIFLIIVFAGILVYLKFCSAGGKQKTSKVESQEEESSSSGIGYTFHGHGSNTVGARYQNTMYQQKSQTYFQTANTHQQSRQTYTNLPYARQIVGEPSANGNAFLSIAKRVDPAYAQEISHDDFEIGQQTQSGSLGSKGSSAEPLIKQQQLHPQHMHQISRDIGYEGSSNLNATEETESSQVSPQSGYAICQPRLENGGLVISV